MFCEVYDTDSLVITGGLKLVSECPQQVCKFIKVNQILNLNTLRENVLSYYASVTVSVISEYITNKNHGS